MKKLGLILICIIVPLFCAYSQSNEALETLFKPIGKSYNEVNEAAKAIGFVTVNYDKENNGKTEVYELVNKNNSNSKCELRFYSESKTCFYAAFNLPMSMWNNMVQKLDRQGERQGVYFHWKFTKDKYEIMLSKDADNDMFYLNIVRLKS